MYTTVCKSLSTLPLLLSNTPFPFVKWSQISCNTFCSQLRAFLFFNELNEFLTTVPFHAVRYSMFIKYFSCAACLRFTHQSSVRSGDCHGHFKSFSLHFLRKFMVDYCPVVSSSPVSWLLSHLLPEFADIYWNTFYLPFVKYFLCHWLSHNRSTPCIILSLHLLSLSLFFCYEHIFGGCGPRVPVLLHQSTGLVAKLLLAYLDVVLYRT